MAANEQEAIRRRIREGNQRRIDEQKKQRAFDAEERLEKEEEQASRVDRTQHIICFVISLLFLSLPLTEPEVKWLEVALFAGMNTVWTLFFHRKSVLHFATMIMLNLLLVQWSSRIYELPFLIASLPLVPTIAFVALNAAAIGCSFLWYINLATLARVRAERWDTVLACLIVVDIVLLFALGVIPFAVLYDSYKALLQLVMAK